MSQAPSTKISLGRNRNYQLLWGARTLTEVGANASAIALPLLVLTVTGSPAASGLVVAAGAAAQLIAGLPAGALVDRMKCKNVMLICEALQALAAAGLVFALWTGVAVVPCVIAVVVVFGTCRALSEPAEDASLPRIVPAEQLATAVAFNSTRGYLGQLSGVAIGGFLFAVRRWLPFAVEALTHLVAFIGLLFLRLPTQVPKAAPAGNLRREILEGLRWAWSQRSVRMIIICAVGLNLSFHAFYLMAIALAQQRAVPSGEIGLMAAMLGVGGILGALLAPHLHRRLRPRWSIIGVFWAFTLLVPLAIFIHDGYLMGVLLAAMTFLAPTANTTIITYQLLLTPDHLRGRLSSVMNVSLTIAATAGPAAGGALMELLPGAPAILLCSLGTLVLTLVAMASPALRRLPAYDSVAPAGS